MNLLFRPWIALLAGSISATAWGETPEFKPKTVIAKPFRAIKDAKFLKASEVKEQVRDPELVLGVVVEGEARAYPINMLTGPHREIINDKLGGRAIAATW